MPVDKMMVKNARVYKTQTGWTKYQSYQIIKSTGSQSYKIIKEKIIFV